MATIVVVDDNPTNQELVAFILGSEGHSVLQAADGIEGLALVRSSRPDLVIADILMPRMDGFEFIRQLRTEPDIAATRVIYCSAVFAEQEARELAEPLGVAGIVAEPIEPEELLKTVRTALATPAEALPIPQGEFSRRHIRLLTDKLYQKVKMFEQAEIKVAAFLETRRQRVPPRPILLVEDNPMDLDFALQAFEEHSVVNPIAVCRDGEEALEYIEAHGAADDSELPILVMLDLRLPKVDGIEVLRQARQHPVWKQVPFIVLTTSRQNQDIQTAYELGVNSYIVKPVEFGAFSEVVKTVKVYWLLTNQAPFPDDG
jgi:CheY-like chemotaxis protein